MKERLTNNLGLKVLSIFLAFFVWLVVMNVSNPENVRSKEVPLEIENERVLAAAGKTYEVNGKNTVTVSYSVRARDEYKIRANDFRAYIDLAELYDVTGAVQVKVEVLNNKEIVSNVYAKTPTVRIETEDLRQKRFDLQATHYGELEDASYAVNDIALKPKYVYVNGPVSLVSQIDRVVVELNLSDLDSDVSGEISGIKAPEFIDTDGNKLNLGDRVTINNPQIEYTVTINRVKNLNLDFEVMGNVANGYRFTGVESNLKTVSVQGLKTTLANLNKITIPASALNIEGASSDRRVTVDLQQFLPEGVTIVGASGTAEVLLKVERLESRRFALSSSAITFDGADDGYQYVISPEKVELTVQGLSEDLDSLKPESFGAVLDVSKFEPGRSYPGKLTVTQSDVYDVLSYTDFTVITANEGEEVTPETTADPERDDPDAVPSSGHSAATNDTTDSAEETTADGS